VHAADIPDHDFTLLPAEIPHLFEMKLILPYAELDI
jgi:hypothetical protein